MQLIAQCYHYLFWGALLLLGAGLIAVLVYIIGRPHHRHQPHRHARRHRHLDSDLSARRGLPRRYCRGVCGSEFHRRGDALPHLHQSL